MRPLFSLQRFWIRDKTLTSDSCVYIITNNKICVRMYKICLQNTTSLIVCRSSLNEIHKTDPFTFQQVLLADIIYNLNIILENVYCSVCLYTLYFL